MKNRTLLLLLLAITALVSLVAQDSREPTKVDAVAQPIPQRPVYVLTEVVTVTLPDKTVLSFVPMSDIEKLVALFPGRAKKLTNIVIYSDGLERKTE